MSNRILKQTIFIASCVAYHGLSRITRKSEYDYPDKTPSFLGKVSLLKYTNDVQIILKDFPFY